MTAVISGAPMTAPKAGRSEGVWHAAWRRFRSDRIGLVCAVIVIAFLLLIMVAALGGVAGNWQREVGVANAPPTFLGPRPPEATGTIEIPKGPNVDLSAVDPLAPRYKEWEERAAMFKRYVPSKRHTMQVDFEDYVLAGKQERRRGERRAA